MRLKAIGKSDKGPVRQQNQDSILLDDKLHLYILADGMGGHSGGAEASSIAANMIRDRLRNGYFKSTCIDDFISESVTKVNHDIYTSQAEKSHSEKMGTTLVLLWFHGDKVLIANVGDSRCYRLRKGNLVQLTEDHNLLQKIRKADPTFKDEKNIGLASALTRTIGISEESVPDIFLEELEDGDLFFLCSDGVSNEYEPEEIAEILEVNPSDCEETIERLMAETLSRHPADNFSSVLVYVEETSPSEVKFSNQLKKRTRWGSIATVSLLLLMAILVVVILAVSTSNDPLPIERRAVIEFENGSFESARTLFKEALTTEESDQQKLRLMLGIYLSECSIESRNEKEVRERGNEVLSLGEELKMDISDLSTWPIRPSGEILLQLKNTAREKWVDCLDKKFTTLIESVKTSSQRDVYLLRLEEAKKLYTDQLKIGQALKVLATLEVDLNK